MAIEQIIRSKRDGRALSEGEIQAFVRAVADEEASDAQIAAFTMATWFNGMNAAETSWLTRAMRDSGDVLEWEEVDGPVLDKHSTGGVGDLVSLVLAPVVAAAGGVVPMISGRGLGHTGGTLDKLESIPGFDTRPGIERFKALVRKNGLAIVGQSERLAPADRRIYSVRDITATVASPPLMISSILSKKFAEGLDGLALDIKYGSGAFSPDTVQAVALARNMCEVANEAGLACSALVTNMDFPLAYSAGNALEVLEAVELLRGGKSAPRLMDVVIGLSAELLVLGGLAEDAGTGSEIARQMLSTGMAAERFGAMVSGQGGPADLLDRPKKHLADAPFVRPVTAVEEGYVAAVDTLGIGEAVVALGGGRRRSEDRIDPSVGIDQIRLPGDHVERAEPLAFVHAATAEAAESIAGRLSACFTLGDSRAELPAVIHARVSSEDRE